MHKFNKYFAAKALAAMMMTTAFVACDEDHTPDWKDPVASEVAVNSISIADGSTVNYSTAQLDVVYSCPVSLSQTASPTVNGQPAATKISDDRLTVSVLLALQQGKSYEVVIPANGVAGIGTMTFAPEVRVTFRTEAAPRPAIDYLPLINPNATQATKNVYNFLCDYSGRYILSGAMANVNNNNDFAGWIKSVAGKDVAIAGYDFIHLQESPANWIDYSDITPAKTQWEANGLVHYMWHWRVPTDKEAYDARDYNRYDANISPTNGSSGTEFDIREALKEGTWQNECILADIDEVAGYLRLLQDAGIPVIWRPLHEAAGSYRYGNAWFWWGRYGDEPVKQLWNLLYDRLVNHHGLNNLIWVWTAQCESGYEAQMAASYPGNDKVDIVATDIYADNDESQLEAYNALLNMTGGKRMVTLGETGLIQNPDKCKEDGANWSWFNLWYTYDQHTSGSTTDGFGNTAESLKKVMESSFVINRDAMPSLK